MLDQETAQKHLAAVTQLWQLHSLKKFPTIYHQHYVAYGYSHLLQQKIVLKLSHHTEREALTLQALAGPTMVSVLDYAPKHHALLLEQIIPGTPLSSLFPDHEDQANSIAATIINSIATTNTEPEDHSAFPTVQTWLKALDQPNYTQVPLSYIQQATAYATQLLTTGPKTYLLHGDLHHDNILQSHDSWKAIDPKGVIGEQAFEIARFIINPLPTLCREDNAQEIMFKRIAQLAQQCGTDGERIRQWAYVQAVLSACWSEQDGQFTYIDYWLTCAKLLH